MGKPGAIAVVLIVLAALAVLGGCDKSRYPADPGLAGDALGLGLALDMDERQARDVASEAANFKIEILSRDELNERNPYAEHDPGRDLVIGIYTPFDAAAGLADGPAYNHLAELRCYLADPADSKLKLLGQPAATMAPADVMDLCGEPLETVTGNDGVIHLTYRFELPKDHPAAEWAALELVTSHTSAGCHALAISLQPK
ncbi:hypothetical protein JW859_00080 [bacterium]|nr:hypothetical protein [bacterium]